MTGDDMLEALQAEVVGVLKNTPSLADAHIMAEDAGDMETAILKKLGPLNKGDTGKNGLVIIALLPEVADTEANLPGPPVEIAVTLQVIEQPLINRGETTGTGIRSSVAALRALHALHHHGTGTALLTAAKNSVETVKTKPGFLSHQVNLRCRYAGLTGPGKCAPVTATTANDEISLTCATPGAAITYTLGDGYPATPYEGPIAAPDESCVMRAAAAATGLQPSDTTAIRITI